MPFYIMQDFAHSMRYNTNSISFKNNYRQWRETESHYNERAHHTGIQNLTLPYDWQPPPFLKDITEEEAWQVLYLDEPEASIGLYEQGLHQQLDALDGYGTYKIRVHPHFDPKKSWAVLYFRQHLVLAKKEASRIVVYNPAGFRLAKDARIVQMVFMTLESATDSPYAGRYQGEQLGQSS